MPLYYRKNIPQENLVASSRTATAVSSSNAETVLGTFTLPANSLGTSGRLEITTFWRLQGAGGTRTVKVRETNVSGTTMFQVGMAATALSARLISEITNLGATNSQVSLGTAGTGVGSATGDMLTSALDTTVDQTIVITCTMASTLDTGTLEWFDAVVKTPA